MFHRYQALLIQIQPNTIFTRIPIFHSITFSQQIKLIFHHYNPVSYINGTILKLSVFPHILYCQVYVCSIICNLTLHIILKCSWYVQSLIGDLIQPTIGPISQSNFKMPLQTLFLTSLCARPFLPLHAFHFILQSLTRLAHSRCS